MQFDIFPSSDIIPQMTEHEELLTMLDARIRLASEWKESEDVASQRADEMVANYKSNVTEFLRVQPKFLQQSVEDWRRKELRDTGKEISRPKLAFKWIQFVCENQLREIGLMATTRGDISQFLMMFDISDGIGRVTSGIQMAEDWLKRTSVGNVINAMGSADKFFGGTDDEETRQKQIAAYETEAEKCAKSLQEDATGHMLIGERASKLRSGGEKGTSLEIPSYQIPIFLNAGADIAEFVYEKIYPLTAPAVI